MIEYITGEVTDLTPATAVVECMGIGYLLNISLNTYSCLSKGQATRLYVYEAIREDAYQLYGFYDRHERELFILLISVSGVGPNTARMILSSLNPSELEQAIVSENLNLLKSVKGIGAKTAQRVIVDLKAYRQSVSNKYARSLGNLRGSCGCVGDAWIFTAPIAKNSSKVIA